VKPCHRINQRQDKDDSMLIQIVIGSALLLVSIAIAGGSLWTLESILMRANPWLTREPHRQKIMLVLCVASVWALAVVSIGVWLWAATFWALGIFSDLETSVYFSLVSFTTLGFGDILLPQEWRLLSGLAATNGLLNFGVLTAILIEAVRQVRIRQLDQSGS
jgi:hypothetical protein